MRTTGLEGPDELILVETEVTPHVTGVVLDVVPIKLAHHKLGIKLEGTFTNEPLRNEATEGALGDQEAHFVTGVDPLGVGGVFDTVISDSANQGLDKDREAVTVNFVEAEGLLVNGELDATVRIVDEGIALERITHTLIVTGHEGQKLLLQTSLVTEGFSLIGRANEDHKLASTITEVFRGEVVAHVVAQGHKELMGDRGGRKATEEVDSNLIVAAGKQLTEVGGISPKDRLDAGEVEELRTNVSRVKGLDGILKILLSNTIRVQNSITALVQADRRTLTAKGLKLGREDGLTELGLGAYRTASLNRGIEGRVREALVGHLTVSNEGTDRLAHMVGSSATLNNVGVRIVKRNIAHGVGSKNRDLRSDTRRVVARCKSAISRKGHFITLL
jgi:hypothetical protein